MARIPPLNRLRSPFGAGCCVRWRCLKQSDRPLLPRHSRFFPVIPAYSLSFPRKRESRKSWIPDQVGDDGGVGDDSTPSGNVRQL
jgi:hypothetical protein